MSDWRWQSIERGSPLDLPHAKDKPRRRMTLWLIVALLVALAFLFGCIVVLDARLVLG